MGASSSSKNKEFLVAMPNETKGNHNMNAKGDTRNPKDFGEPKPFLVPKKLTNNYKQNVYLLAKLMKDIHLDNYYQMKMNGFVENTHAQIFKCPWKDRIGNKMNRVAALLKTLKMPQRAKMTFVMRGDVFNGLQTIPSHEQAKSLNLLCEIPTSMKSGASFGDTLHEITKWGEQNLEPLGDEKVLLFASHKWHGNNPDDAENNTMRKIKDTFYLKDFPETTYVWFDYFSVPQQNQKEKMKALQAIPSVMSFHSIIPFHANDDLQEKYDSSIWCQLEAIMLRQTNTLRPTPTRNFTIYDWNDLYAVLPGFFELYCDMSGIKAPRFFEHFPAADQQYGWLRSQILAQILDAFVKFHEKNN